MRVTTAFNKMLGIVGATVVSASCSPVGMIVGLRRRRCRPVCPCGWKGRAVYDRSIRRWRHLDLGAVKLFRGSRDPSCPLPALRSGAHRGGALGPSSRSSHSGLRRRRRLARPRLPPLTNPRRRRALANPAHPPRGRALRRRPRTLQLQPGRTQQQDPLDQPPRLRPPQRHRRHRHDLPLLQRTDHHPAHTKVRRTRKTVTALPQRA